MGSGRHRRRRVRPPANRVLALPGYGALKKQANEGIQPLTQLFMKYMKSIRPRCKDCIIVRRRGCTWRLCKIQRHKARQPGVNKVWKILKFYRGKDKSTFGRELPWSP